MWRPRQSSLKQERKRCPEGRGGRDRPVEVRIQQQARKMPGVEATVRVAPWGKLRRQPLGWLVPQALAGSLLQKPLLGPPSRPFPSKTLASLQLTKAKGTPASSGTARDRLSMTRLPTQ